MKNKNYKKKKVTIRKKIKTYYQFHESKILKSILLFCFLSLIFLIFILPAYNSAKWEKNRDVLNNPKVAAYYSPSTDIIVLNINSTFSLRHELTHREQVNEGRLSDEFIGSFVNELECYIEELFIWRKVNLTTLDWEKK